MSSFPFYKQLDTMDCGPTCLRMIAKHFGKQYPLSFLRDNCYIGKTGVCLKIDAYPYKKFGTINSYVEEISTIIELSNDESVNVAHQYSVIIGLDYRINTNHNKKIDFQDNSSLLAEIITIDKTILERVMETFLSNRKKWYV